MEIIPPLVTQCCSLHKKGKITVWLYFLYQFWREWIGSLSYSESNQLLFNIYRNSWVPHILWILINCNYYPFWRLWLSHLWPCLPVNASERGFACCLLSRCPAAPSALLTRMLIPCKSSYIGGFGNILLPSFVRNMSTGFGFSHLVSLSVCLIFGQLKPVQFSLWVLLFVFCLAMSLKCFIPSPLSDFQAQLVDLLSQLGINYFSET